MTTSVVTTTVAIMTTPCAVQRCSREATWPVRLKEPGEVSATYIWTEVCKPHWDLLSSKSVEWVLEITKDPLNERWHQQTLLVGEELGPLDEFTLQAAPAVKARPEVYSRIYSDEAHDGLHITFEVRRRGSQEAETMTVVVPPSMIEGFAELLRDSQPPAAE